MNKKGFTLLELLIVVIIIGILAAIALPQYEKTVTKSKSAQMSEAVSSIAKAAQTFYMLHGSWQDSFEELDIDYAYPKNSTSVCLSGLYGESFQKDNLEFVIHKNSSDTNPYNHISVRFANGPYKCTGFAFLLNYQNNPDLENRLLCYERLGNTRGSKNQKGDFCTKIMGYTSSYTTVANSVYFW